MNVFKWMWLDGCEGMNERINVNECMIKFQKMNV